MQVNTRNTSTLPIQGPPGHQQKPSQAVFLRLAQMSLFARVTCYPPLGQLTCVQRVQKALRSEEDDLLRFTVVIESSNAFPAQSWEAQIWHNISSTEWTALPLKKRDPSSAPLLTGNESEYSYHRYVFSAELRLPATGGHAQFTVRFRTSSDTKWQWANQQHSVSDGEVVFTPRILRPVQGPSTESASAESTTTSNAKEELGKYIDSLSSDVQVESRASEAPGATLWALSGDADPAREGTSGVKLVPLGTPSSLLKYFALVRVWSPWLGPRHGKDKFRLTEDALLCSFLRKDGFHLVLLAVSSVKDVLTLLQSTDNGEIMVKARSDNMGASKFQILVAVAENFEVAMSAVMYEARKVVKPFTEAANLSSAVAKESSPVSSSGDDDMVVVEKDPKMQWLAEWFDGLTYCTWNGLGQNLTEEKILQALEALKSHGINVANLIIDDNWQTLDNEGESQFKRRWRQFEANPKGFPRGLKETVEAIRRNNPSIEHVAVWHSLLGYWGGISPDGDLAQRYKTKKVKVKDPATGGPIAHNITDGKILAIDPDNVQQFYDEFYSFLTSVGVDSVKTDSQFFLDLLEDPEDRKRFTTSYQDAWSISALKQFGTRSISCMSLIPQIIFHSQLPNNRPAIPLRNSDDFFPEVPASHPWHLFCNAHNALLTRYLNALPDWDMFQTSHPYASFHAAARCVSGGPVYITDEPGKHDLNILYQMTAPTVQGNSVILRPSTVGRTIDIYHDYNEGHVLRVGCYTGWAKTGSGILGLFNIQSAEVSCMVPLMDFPGIYEDSDELYVVRAHSSGKITRRMRPLARDSLVSVVLSQKGWEILTAYPTRSFTLRGSQGCNASGNSLTHVAVLGLLGKMTGAAALVTSDISVVENGRLRFDVTLKALGVLGIYFSDLQDRSIARNFMVMISGKAVPRKTVWKEGGEDANVLAIDVLSAWKALRLDSGWSNEVVVQAFVG